MLLDSFHKGYVDLADFLLRSGASSEAKDRLGKTVNEYLKNDYPQKTEKIKL